MTTRTEDILKNCTPDNLPAIMREFGEWSDIASAYRIVCIGEEIVAGKLSECAEIFKKSYALLEEGFRRYIEEAVVAYAEQAWKPEKAEAMLELFNLTPTRVATNIVKDQIKTAGPQS